ncbi:hypothetical protein ACJIZ3_019718 [Penstemon smallii]|uniref:Uncharacterized protein n=1 Tax=Penstemon smallii TaxID=265156 RepID=A0ABD3T1X7_9LAMI
MCSEMNNRILSTLYKSYYIKMSFVIIIQPSMVRVNRSLSTLYKMKMTNHEIPIYCDNTSVISLTQNTTSHSRTKHIEIKHHFIRDHGNFLDVISSQDSTELGVVDPHQMWIDVVGPPNKKGKSYGLVAEAKFVKSGSSRGLSQNQQPPDEVINEIFTLKSQCQTYAERIEKLEEGNMFHQQPVALFDPSLMGPGYMVNMSSPHAQSQPQDVTRPLSQHPNDQDSI